MDEEKEILKPILLMIDENGNVVDYNSGRSVHGINKVTVFKQVGRPVISEINIKMVNEEGEFYKHAL